MSARPMPIAAALCGMLALGALAAACGGNDDEAAERPPLVAKPEDFPKTNGRTLAQVREKLGQGGLLLTPSVSQLEPGKNRFGFGLFSTDGAQISEAPAALYVAPAGGGPAKGPFLARFESLDVEPQFRSRTVSADPEAARSVYVADVGFERRGTYEVLGIVRLDGRLVAAAPEVGPLEVKDSLVPEAGEPAPRIHTPTPEDVGGDLARIDTRVPPSDMHEEDFADVVGRKPVVLLFSTPALCESRVCGPMIDIAEQVKAEVGDKAEFIHMEIYNDNEVERGFRPQVLEWRLPTEPWLFTVDRKGRVAASLEGAFSASELERAVEKAVAG